MPEFLDQFVERAFTMPTTVWSVLLILVILYWTLSLLAGLDLEGLDEAMDATEGLDGAFDAADGMLDAADGALDAADAGFDAAEGLEALDGLGDGLDDGLRMEPRPGFFARMGFGELPRIFTWTLVVIFGWCFSYFGLGWLDTLGWLQTAGTWAVRGLAVGFLLGIASLFLAVMATAVAIQPLRKLLATPGGAQRVDFVGRTCVVKTTRVGDDFGQAELATGQLVQVRALPGDDASFEYGQPARVVQYDPAREIFYIQPLASETA